MQESDKEVLNRAIEYFSYIIKHNKDDKQPKRIYSKA
jgi:hypothetical protein